MNDYYQILNIKDSRSLLLNVVEGKWIKNMLINVTVSYI